MFVVVVCCSACSTSVQAEESHDIRAAVAGDNKAATNRFEHREGSLSFGLLGQRLCGEAGRDNCVGASRVLDIRSTTANSTANRSGHLYPKQLSAQLTRDVRPDVCWSVHQQVWLPADHAYIGRRGHGRALSEEEKNLPRVHPKYDGPRRADRSVPSRRRNLPFGPSAESLVPLY